MKKERIFTIPNIITFIRILMVLILPLFKDNYYVLITLATLIIVGDLEGTLARKLNQVTKLGAALDKLADLMFVIVSLLFFFVDSTTSLILVGIIFLTRIIKNVLLTKSIKNTSPFYFTKITYLIVYVLIIIRLFGFKDPLILQLIVILYVSELVYCLVNTKKSPKVKKEKDFFREFADKTKLYKDKIILPLIKIISYFGITPKMITYFSLLVGLVSSYYLYIGDKIIFLIIAIISHGFDGLDGSLARFQNKATKFGKELDYWTDRIIILSMMVVVILLNPEHFFYWGVPIIYLGVHLFSKTRKKQNTLVHIRPIYYLAVYFSFFYATLIALAASLINIIILIIKRK
jgi:phosphatidylglycerophosphate synthase